MTCQEWPHVIKTLSAKSKPRATGYDPQVHEHENPFRDFPAVAINSENPELSLIWSCTDPNPERVAADEAPAVDRKCTAALLGIGCQGQRQEPFSGTRFRTPNCVETHLQVVLGRLVTFYCLLELLLGFFVICNLPIAPSQN